MPGLRTCGPHLSAGAKIGIAFAVSLTLLLIVGCSIIWWKRRQNILRAQRLAGKKTHEKPPCYNCLLVATSSIVY